jgi:hypothetical protein
MAKEIGTGQEMEEETEEALDKLRTRRIWRRWLEE